MSNSALFGALSSGPTISEISLADIRPDPDQPRKTFDEEPLKELAQSIVEHGVLQPILVRKDPHSNGKYLIISGERRFRASQLAEQATIPAILRDEKNAAVIAIIENVQRVDLSPIEEAEAVARLIEEQKISQGDAAKLLGKNRQTIQQLLKINTLPLHIHGGARDTDVSKSILVELAGLDNEDTQLRLWKRAKEGNLTVSEIRKAKKDPEAADKPNEGGARRLAPAQRALAQLRKGVDALQGKTLSEEERAQVLEEINRLNAITVIAGKPSEEGG